MHSDNQDIINLDICLTSVGKYKWWFDETFELASTGDPWS